jgi:hypothetical protein
VVLALTAAGDRITSLNGFLGAITASTALLVPATALAQSDWLRLPSDSARYRSADDAQGPYYETRRVAYDQGYREGVKRGEEDARRGDRFAYQDERDFQHADRGYHRSLGDRDRYRQIFRDGYAAGYSAGYSRFSRYARNTGRPGSYGPQGVYGSYGGYGGYGHYSPAFDNGVREGHEKGREDARKNRSYDVLRHSWYRSGDRHFEREYGSRDQYKDLYRRGFQQGYERGYREGRYWW